MYYTYILKSKTKKSFYIGQTQDLIKRLKEHNDGLSRSTRSYRPFELVYKAKFKTRSEAVRLEKYLKSLKNRR